MINKKEVEDFIYSVFNYYNGRINVYNIAFIEINWLDIPSNTNAAITTNPNRVMIFPMTIKKYTYNYNDFKFHILLSIIHELYHVDQFISYTKLSNDINYVNRIENCVEVMSMSYVSTHINEIYNLFNLDIRDISIKEFKDYINKYSDGKLYERKTYVDHICLLIDDIIRYNKNVSKYIIQQLVECFENEYSKIIININDNELLIKDKDKYMDLEIINKVFYDNHFKYSLRTVNINSDYNNEYGQIIYTLNIKSEGKNVLCKIVNKQDNPDRY